MAGAHGADILLSLGLDVAKLDEQFDNWVKGKKATIPVGVGEEGAKAGAKKGADAKADAKKALELFKKGVTELRTQYAQLERDTTALGAETSQLSKIFDAAGRAGDRYAKALIKLLETKAKTQELTGEELTTLEQLNTTVRRNAAEIEHATRMGRGRAKQEREAARAAAQQGAATDRITQALQRQRVELARLLSVQTGRRVGTGAAEMFKTVTGDPEALKLYGRQLLRVSDAHAKATGQGLLHVDQSRQLRKSLDDLSKDTIPKLVKKVAGWLVATAIVFRVVRAFEAMKRMIMDVDTAMADLRKVVGDTKRDADIVQALVVEAGKAVVNYGGSLKDVIEIQRDWYRTTQDVRETIELTKVSLLAMNIAELTVAASTRLLTATMKQYGMDASQAITILDTWNELSNRAGVSTEAVAGAVSRASAAFRTAGVTMQELSGLAATTIRVTGRTGEQVGTLLRTIAAYYVRPETVTALSREIQVDVEGVGGRLKDLMTVLGEVAGRWDGLTNVQKRNVAATLGATRRYSEVQAILTNWEKVLLDVRTAYNSVGSALRENQVFMESMGRQMGRLQGTWQTLVMAWVQATGVLNVLQRATEAAAGGGGALNEKYGFAIRILTGLAVTLATLATPAVMAFNAAIAGGATASIAFTTALGVFNPTLLLIALAIGLLTFGLTILASRMHRAKTEVADLRSAFEQTRDEFYAQKGVHEANIQLLELHERRIAALTAAVREGQAPQEELNKARQRNRDLIEEITGILPTEASLREANQRAISRETEAIYQQSAAYDILLAKKLADAEVTLATLRRGEIAFGRAESQASAALRALERRGVTREEALRAAAPPMPLPYFGMETQLPRGPWAWQKPTGELYKPEISEEIARFRTATSKLEELKDAHLSFIAQQQTIRKIREELNRQETRDVKKAKGVDPFRRWLVGTVTIPREFTAADIETLRRRAAQETKQRIDAYGKILETMRGELDAARDTLTETDFEEKRRDIDKLEKEIEQWETARTALLQRIGDALAPKGEIPTTESIINDIIQDMVSGRQKDAAAQKRARRGGPKEVRPEIAPGIADVILSLVPTPEQIEETRTEIERKSVERFRLLRDAIQRGRRIFGEDWYQEQWRQLVREFYLSSGFVATEEGKIVLDFGKGTETFLDPKRRTLPISAAIVREVFSDMERTIQEAQREQEQLDDQAKRIEASLRERMVKTATAFRSIGNTLDKAIEEAAPEPEFENEFAREAYQAEQSHERLVERWSNAVDSIIDAYDDIRSDLRTAEQELGHKIAPDIIDDIEGLTATLEALREAGSQALGKGLGARRLQLAERELQAIAEAMRGIGATMRWREFEALTFDAGAIFPLSIGTARRVTDEAKRTYDDLKKEHERTRLSMLKFGKDALEQELIDLDYAYARYKEAKVNQYELDRWYTDARQLLYEQAAQREQEEYERTLERIREENARTFEQVKRDIGDALSDALVGAAGFSDGMKRMLRGIALELVRQQIMSFGVLDRISSAMVGGKMKALPAPPVVAAPTIMGSGQVVYTRPAPVAPLDILGAVESRWGTYTQGLQLREQFAGADTMTRVLNKRENALSVSLKNVEPQASRAAGAIPVTVATPAQAGRMLGGRQTLSQLLVAGSIATGAQDPVSGTIMGGLAGLTFGPVEAAVGGLLGLLFGRRAKKKARAAQRAQEAEQRRQERLARTVRAPFDVAFQAPQFLPYTAAFGGRPTSTYSKTGGGTFVANTQNVMKIDRVLVSTTGDAKEAGREFVAGVEEAANARSFRFEMSRNPVITAGLY